MENYQYLKIEKKEYAKDMAEIWSQSFNYHYTNYDIEAIKNYLPKENMKIYGSFHESKLISVATFQIYEDYIYLKWIATHPNYRRNKIATKLLKYSFNNLKRFKKDIKLNCNKEYLETFYETLGFITYQKKEMYQAIYNQKQLIRYMRKKY